MLASKIRVIVEVLVNDREGTMCDRQATSTEGGGEELTAARVYPTVNGMLAKPDPMAEAREFVRLRDEGKNKEAEQLIEKIAARDHEDTRQRVAHEIEMALHRDRL